ncbi:MAG: hypothetical protein IPK60_06805 [Sandaracinaceae bacterium]|nr:hypothetical protein [Sandaracinaceae bacterium]
MKRALVAASVAVACAFAQMPAYAQDEPHHRHHRDGGTRPRDAGADTRDAGLDQRDASAAQDAVVHRDAAVNSDAGVPRADAGPVLRETTLAPEHRPRLSLEVSPASGVMTGDVIHVTLVADALTGDDVTVPQQSFAPFELHSSNMVRGEMNNGRRRTTFRLDLLALEPGSLAIPVLTVRIATADGEIGNVLTASRPVRVGSVLGNTPNAQPKPPTQPVIVMEDDYTLAWIGGIVLALILTAAITLLIARYLRRRKKAIVPSTPPRPPWDVAMEKLNALRMNQARLLAEGRMMEFVDGVSDAVREYLGNRYGFVGLESTTDEVIAYLRKVDRLGVAREQVGAMLSDCDLVKFAKAVPDDAQCQHLLDGAFYIVRATIPVVPVGPTSDGGRR